MINIKKTLNINKANITMSQGFVCHYQLYILKLN